MNWTSTYPEKPGWYWLRNDAFDRYLIVEVVNPHILVRGLPTCAFSVAESEWCGPIDVPDDFDTCNDPDCHRCKGDRTDTHFGKWDQVAAERRAKEHAARAVELFPLLSEGQRHVIMLSMRQRYCEHCGQYLFQTGQRQECFCTRDD